MELVSLFGRIETGEDGIIVLTSDQREDEADDPSRDQI